MAKRKKATVDTKKLVFHENSESEDFEIKESEDENISLSDDEDIESDSAHENHENALSDSSEKEKEINEQVKKKNKKNDHEFTKISWGKDKRNYYQEEDENSSSESEDEEDKLERLKEAIYLNEKEKEKLKETDFDIRNIYMNGENWETENDNENEKKKDSSENHADTIKKLITGINKDMMKQKENIELNISEEQKKEATELIMSEQEEYKTLLTDLSVNIEKVYTEINENKELFEIKAIDEKQTDSSDINKNTLLYLKKKNEALLTYIIYMTYYIFLKSVNSYSHNHPVLEKLIYMNTILNKANELDPKIKFKINQLNSAAANVEQQTEAEEEEEEEEEKEEKDVEDDDEKEEEDSIDEANAYSGYDIDMGVDVKTEDGYKEDIEMDKNSKNAKYRIKKNLITEYTDCHIRAKEKEEKKKNREKIRNEKDIFIKELKTMTSEKPEKIEDNYLKKLEKKLSSFDNKLSKKEVKKIMQKSQKNNLSNVGLSTNDLLKFVELPEMNKEEKKNSFEEKKIFRNNMNKLKQMKKNELTKSTVVDDYVTYKKIDKEKLINKNINKELQGKDRNNKNKNKRLALNVNEIHDEEIQNMLKFKKQKKENKHKINEERNKEIRKKLVMEENEEVGNRRKPDIDIIKNKGLMKKKKSKVSSTRARHRQKFEKKMKSYSSQHNKLREHDDNYSGEQRGINPNIKRSMAIN